MNPTNVTFQKLINRSIKITTLFYKIPPHSPCLPAGRLCQREEQYPSLVILFLSKTGKERGGDFKKGCIFNYGLLE